MVSSLLSTLSDLSDLALQRALPGSKAHRDLFSIEVDRVVVASNEDLATFRAHGHEKDEIQIASIGNADEHERDGRQMDCRYGHADLGESGERTRYITPFAPLVNL